MHETVVAQKMLEAILAESEKQKARPVTATISCGQFNTVNDDILEEAFAALARETVCSDTKLNIKHKPLRALCNKCHKEFQPDLSRPQCTHCGCEDFEYLPDAPLMLEEIEFNSE